MCPKSLVLKLFSLKAIGATHFIHTNIWNKYLKRHLSSFHNRWNGQTARGRWLHLYVVCVHSSTFELSHKYLIGHVAVIYFQLVFFSLGRRGVLFLRASINISTMLHSTLYLQCNGSWMLFLGKSRWRREGFFY